MRILNRRLVLGWAGATLAGVALAGAAIAQPMGPGMQRGPGGGPGFGRGMNDPVSYLAALKTELAITPVQDPAWKAYAEVVETMAGQMKGMHANTYEAMQTATWQERQEMMNAMFQSRTEAHRMVHDAAEKLLPELTPAQRSQAAAKLPGLMPQGRGGMGRGGMGQGTGQGMGPGMGQGMGRGMGQGMGPGAGGAPAATQ
jgi:hypothetical protein